MEDQNQARVVVAEHAVSATLILPKDFDRSTLTADACMAFLKRAEIDPDVIDQNTIIEIVTEAMAAEPGQFTAEIAHAIPATHGIDAYIEWIGKDAQDKDEETREELKEDESVCFYARSNFSVVKSGDILGKTYLEVPGIEGKDVRGKAIAARTAKPLDFKFDDSIGIDETNQLVAQIDGVVFRDRKTARVSDTLEIDDNVDFSTGNIDFPGNVLVRQGVKDCFTVQARDDIEVRGLIEAATIIAGKDLYLKGGFAGREQGVAKIECNLHGKYLDGVIATIGEDLRIEREIINCTCTVLGNIISPSGSLIGGKTYAAGRVELMDLGASAQPITELHIGSLPHLDPLIDELTHLIDQMVEDREALLAEEEMITANSGARIAPSHQAKLDEIRKTMGSLQIQLDRAEPALQAVRERAEEKRQIDLLVHRKVHPNALIICGGYHYRITNEIKGPVRIMANKRGQLEIREGDSKPRLLSTEAELRTAA